MNALKASLRTLVALITLLFCLSGSWGSAQVSEEKVMQLRKAAEQGDAELQCNLTLAYIRGNGVPQDYAEAVKWYRLVAEQGDVDAIFKLGSSYYNGKGVPRDDVLAYMWLNIAAVSGIENSKTDMANLSKRMTPEQIAEAQKLSREWKPKMQ